MIIIDEYTDLFQDKVYSKKEMIRLSRITQIAQWGPMVNVHLIRSTNRTERIFFPPYACRIYPHIFRMTIGL